MRVLYVKSIFRRLLLKFYTAIIGILFVLIFLSFPFGAYVIFNAEIGSTITYEFQLDSFYVFFAGLPVDLPINNQLGETFIIFWCFYLLFFTILMLGPRKNILQSLVGTVQGEEQASRDNALQMIIVWLAVLLIIYAVNALYIFPVEKNTKPNLLANNFAVEDFPDAANPSIAIIIFNYSPLSKSL